MYLLVQADFDRSLNKHPFFTASISLIRMISYYCFTFSEYSLNESFDFFQQLINETYPLTKVICYTGSKFIPTNFFVKGVELYVSEVQASCESD